MTFQRTEVVVPRARFAEILRRIDTLQPRPVPNIAKLWLGTQHGAERAGAPGSNPDAQSNHQVSGFIFTAHTKRASLRPPTNSWVALAVHLGKLCHESRPFGILTKASKSQKFHFTNYASCQITPKGNKLRTKASSIVGNLVTFFSVENRMSVAVAMSKHISRIDNWPIDPGSVQEISYEQFVRNSSEFITAALNGTIIKICGNPYLLRIIRQYVKPAINRENYSFFCENTTSLYNTQVIQKALFSEIQQRRNYFVESHLRFRRTVGCGAFVGPHCDRFEGLPQNSVNFWTSFVDLEAGETINFYDSSWHPKHNLAGHKKLGVYRDSKKRLMPTDDLLAASISYSCAAGDTILFNSGSTIHSSPFFVSNQRITSDVRLVVYNNEIDLQCKTYKDYYRLEDQDKFDGTRSPKLVLNDVWKKYEIELDLFGLNDLESKNKQRKKLLDNVSTGLDPSTAILLWQKLHLGQADELAIIIIDQHPYSISPRLSLLGLTKTPALTSRIVREVLYHPVENPGKALKAISSVSSPLKPSQA